MRYTVLVFVLACMIGYRQLLHYSKTNTKDLGNLGMMIVNGITFVYSCLIIVFGTVYKKLSQYIAEKENFQYQSQYENALIERLFLFNMFNFYLPIFLVGFVE